MEFSVGDLVMHPQFGPGRVIGLEDREWVEGFKHYCVMEIPARSLTLRLPVRSLEELGIRPIMTKRKVSQVMRALGGKSDPLPDDADTRYRELRERIRTCRPLKLASVVRDLTWRQRDNNLTKRDNDCMDQARQLLTSEIASAMGDAAEPVEHAIKAALDRSLSRAPAKEN